ncbi:MAG: hypothetical protein BMS9Abin36_2188 [Gammaproteobacteria bacterium]|nr:MAG: hypothetical protein BMS9Abin36_2188 [Gammaproteobacteria bacterium]
MQISNLLIGVDDELDLGQRAFLAKTITPMLGVYQAFFHFHRPNCQGLWVKYDSNIVCRKDIIDKLCEQNPGTPWHVCNPDIDCEQCPSYKDSALRDDSLTY